MKLKSFLLFLMSTATSPVSAAESQHDSAQWEPDIRQFVATDVAHPPPKHGIVFVGSSSIRLWDLPRWFPDLPVINRGFGGSQIADSIDFVEPLVLKHRPRTVVLYAGDNDVNAGKSAEVVHRDFQRFVRAIHDELPEARIVFIAIKPSIARWRLAQTMHAANRLILAECEDDERLVFVDIWEPMLAGNDGPPPEKWFVDDGLHLSDPGYELWTGRVLPHLVHQEVTVGSTSE